MMSVLKRRGSKTENTKTGSRVHIYQDATTRETPVSSRSPVVERKRRRIYGADEECEREEREREIDRGARAYRNNNSSL